MLITIGMGVLGAIALISMIMMMGNVISKSPYGRVWALISGFSALFCAVLLVLRILMPSLDVKAATPVKKSTATTTDPQAASASPSQTETRTTTTAEADTATVGNVQAQSLSSDGQDLSFLATVLQYLKEGKPIPPEFLALLPDGGLSIAEAQAKMTTAAPTISKPLQSQLVSLARSVGRSTYTSDSYVPIPTTPHAPSGTSGSSNGSGHAGGVTSTPGNNGTTNPGSGGSSTPVQQPPAPTPAPQPTPTPSPVPTPPAAGTLVDGGLLKSVLGHSQDEVKTYFMYNQFLGQNNGTLIFLRGSATVYVSFANGYASQVTLNVGRFTPSGKDSTYYVNFLQGLAGLSDTTPTSGSGGNLTWAGVYPGASSVTVQVDTASNSGTLTAKL